MTTQSVTEMTVDALATCHSHLRETDEQMGPLIANLVKGGCDVIGPMPNPNGGLRTAQETWNYNAKAAVRIPEGIKLEIIPIMLCTELTPLDELRKAADGGITHVKFFPLDRTTGSDLLGVRHYSRVLPHVKLCGELHIDTHFHPEHPWLAFSNDDAEFAFLPLGDMFLNETQARIFWEHGSDGRCIPFWIEMAASGRFFVTLTAHHLVSNSDDAFGDVRKVCKPSLKSRREQLCLIDLVAKDYPWVVAGPDDAPHPHSKKHVSEGRCACGDYTAPFLHPLYAHGLDSVIQGYRGVETYQNFTSRNLRKILNLSEASRQVSLVRNPLRIPGHYRIGSWTVEPFGAESTISWSFAA